VPSGTSPGAYRGGWHSAVVGPFSRAVSSTSNSSPHPLGITSDARLDEHFTQIREMERRLVLIDEARSATPMRTSERR
jgi:hypothetical protein